MWYEYGEKVSESGIKRQKCDGKSLKAHELQPVPHCDSVSVALITALAV